MIVPDYTDARLPNAVMPKALDVGEHAAVLFPHDLVKRHTAETSSTSMRGFVNSTLGTSLSKPIPVPN
jgi:hypothetical protein